LETVERGDGNKNKFLIANSLRETLLALKLVLTGMLRFAFQRSSLQSASCLLGLLLGIANGGGTSQKKSVNFHQISQQNIAEELSSLTFVVLFILFCSEVCLL
jgi:hypothetical protein